MALSQGRRKQGTHALAVVGNWEIGANARHSLTLKLIAPYARLILDFWTACIRSQQLFSSRVVRIGESTSYSTLNASVGFTPEARCAGISAAASPAEQRTRIVLAITAGSEGFTS